MSMYKAPMEFLGCLIETQGSKGETLDYLAYYLDSVIYRFYKDAKASSNSSFSLISIISKAIYPK